jgi:hypothetical protein
LDQELDMAHRVLVAHGDMDYLGTLMAELTERGMEVVGPADRARMALSLAAIQPVDCAIVGRRLAGTRDGADLALCLHRDWGIPATLIDMPPPTELWFEGNR